MYHSNDIKELAAALAKAQGAMKPAAQSGKNPHFKSTFATLQDVWEAATPALHENGLSVVQSTEAQDDAGLTVVTMLLHASGQWMRGEVRIPLAKADAQAVGSAISYGRRYGLAAMLGIVADEDDDGNAATAAAPARREAPPRQDLPRRSSSPADRVMPFGRNKGKRLADIADDDLHNAIEWCRETPDKAEKFADLINDMSRVLAERELDLSEVPV